MMCTKPKIFYGQFRRFLARAGHGPVPCPAFMSFLTATFVIESMACANAIVHHRKMQRLKSRISVTQDTSNTPPTPIDQEEEIATSDSGRATPSNFHYVNQMD